MATIALNGTVRGGAIELDSLSKCPTANAYVFMSSCLIGIDLPGHLGAGLVMILSTLPWHRSMRKDTKN